MPDSDSKIPATGSPADIRCAAMNLLARREHSLAELRQKLQRRFTDKVQLEVQLQQLAEEKLQSDERYAESFARQRISRGYGPLRVRQEMREKGLTDQAVSAALEAVEVDWVASAAQVFRKKFGRRDCLDIKEKSRRIRFMQYRGFSPEHYQALLEL